MYLACLIFMKPNINVMPLELTIHIFFIIKEINQESSVINEWLEAGQVGEWIVSLGLGPTLPTISEAVFPGLYQSPYEANTQVCLASGPYAS